MLCVSKDYDHVVVGGGGGEVSVPNAAFNVGAFVPSDESRHTTPLVPNSTGGEHDEHQQNAWKVELACAHMRTELYMRMRDSLSRSLREGRVLRCQ